MASIHVFMEIGHENSFKQILSLRKSNTKNIKTMVPMQYPLIQTDLFKSSMYKQFRRILRNFADMEFSLRCTSGPNMSYDSWIISGSSSWFANLLRHSSLEQHPITFKMAAWTKASKLGCSQIHSFLFRMPIQGDGVGWGDWGMWMEPIPEIIWWKARNPPGQFRTISKD